MAGYLSGAAGLSPRAPPRNACQQWGGREGFYRDLAASAKVVPAPGHIGIGLLRIPRGGRKGGTREVCVFLGSPDHTHTYIHFASHMPAASVTAAGCIIRRYGCQDRIRISIALRAFRISARGRYVQFICVWTEFTVLVAMHVCPPCFFFVFFLLSVRAQRTHERQEAGSLK